SSVSPTGDTSVSASVAPEEHSVLQPGATLAAVVLQPGATESPLTSPADKRGDGRGRSPEEGGGFAGAATPPPGPALSADRGASPADGFEQLVEAWGPPRLHIADAEAIYRRLRPSSALHERMVLKAREQRAAYDTAGTEPRYRKLLKTWLARSGWRNDASVPT